MSLFAETSWEPNAIADKLSTEIFHKKKQKVTRTKQTSSALKKIHKAEKTNGTVGKKASGKLKSKKKRKAIERAIATSDIVPKKWERKGKPESSGNNQKTRKGSEKKTPPLVEPNQTQTPHSQQKKKRKRKMDKLDTEEKEEPAVEKSISEKGNSEKKKKKLKRKKRKSRDQTELPANVEELPEKPDQKLSVISRLNVKRLEVMLATKDKAMEKRILREPESLRERMMNQLRASRFRYINETLYKNESSESKKMFKEDPDAFAAYHAGYKQQVEQWPLNPLDVIVSAIKKMPKDWVIADLGCGEARLADSVSQRVHSFDLVAVNERVKACDMAHTPLLASGVNVVVFCLSLMGKNLGDYLLEANRVLKMDGTLKIAEIESRFENVDDFIGMLKSFGFVNTWRDLSHNLFYFMDFKKVSEVNRSTSKLPPIELKACLYKKR